jgi:hypothetical protein
MALSELLNRLLRVTIAVEDRSHNEITVAAREGSPCHVRRVLGVLAWNQFQCRT